MKQVIHWAIRNSPAMNTLMVAVLVVGTASMFMLRREVFPEFELEVLLVTVPYPGASPSEVEDGICRRLEEAVQSIDGIKKKTSIAQEGAGFLVLELTSNSNEVQKILAEVRSEIDRIPSLPELAEDPEVKQITLRQVAIRIGVLGPEAEGIEAELALREVAEGVRSDLLSLSSVSQVNIIGARDYQIDVEIPQEILRQYGLTLNQVAGTIARHNIEIPGGSIKSDSEEVLLRGKNKRLQGEELAKIPLLTHPNGAVVTVGELGTVKDDFIDKPAVNLINGSPGLVVSVDRTSSEDLLEIAEEIRAYIRTAELPQGYSLTTWQDSAVDVQDRIDLLRRNGFQGLVLVFLVLAAFLDLRLAFWVALGIPVSVLGACAVLLMFDQTLNMISLFAFLLALGIVVDDAIVIGENIYAHRQNGEDIVTASVNGAYEVLQSVTASVGTTIIAFVPLLYVSGTMGKFIAVMPIAVIAMLVISLIESLMILPCHLGHKENLFLKVTELLLTPFRPVARAVKRVNEFTEDILFTMIRDWYLPSLRWVLKNPALTISIAVSSLVISISFIPGGVTPWNIFPKMDSRWVQAKVIFPDGTPKYAADEATQKIESAIHQVAAEHGSEESEVIRLVHRSVGEIVNPGTMGPDQRTSGGNIGMVFVELEEAEKRDVKSDQLLEEWRTTVGEIPGVDSITFGTPEMGPGGTPIEFKLTASSEYMDELEEAAEACKAELSDSSKYPGLVDIQDDSRPGKWEYQLQVRDNARSMGVTEADLAETVRASYYGAEVMRLQRGRHEVKLMVRYPETDRKSLADFHDILIRSEEGWERPLTELADINEVRGYSEINRLDQNRSITITSDILEDVGNARDSVTKFKQEFMPVLAGEFPHVRVRWEGQQEQTQESMESLFIGFAVAVFAMFSLLTILFRSYVQPLIILLIIPFGFVGAIFGHALMGLQISMFSVFGLVALTGVVVNDSIVLLDFINRRLREGDPLEEALLRAGSRRFRPVVLTSLTTVAGLTPILLETSFQAQVLIPMAASLCFGLILVTFLVLYLAPVFYLLYGWLVGVNHLVAAEPETAPVGKVPKAVPEPA